MFQAKIRGWRRLAAGLVLAPGLTGLGAEALGLLSRASGQERPSTARAEEVRDLKRRASEAMDAKDYVKARELNEKARALQVPAAFYDDAPDEIQTEPARKPSAKSMPPASAAGTKPMTTDPKVLVVLAKQALEAGNVDKAQDLATQAKAQGAAIRWGLFDDTPDSVLKDVYKARGRRDRDVSERLMAEARSLMEKQAATRNERAANLAAAEEKAKKADSMHGTYSMWDFGDRPGDILADVRKARAKEKIVASKPTMDAEPGEMPTRGSSGYGSKTTNLDTRATARTDGIRPVDVARKKAAIALMQEGKAMEVGGHYADAKKKYVEAARLNAGFGQADDTPESELSRLNILAQRKINALADEAKSCMERKDSRAAEANLDEAYQIATGMGLDPSAVAELSISMKGGATKVARAGAKMPAEGPAPMPRIGTKSSDEGTNPVVRIGIKTTDDGPPPIIRSKPIDDGPSPIIRSGRKPMTDEVADAGKTEVKTVGGEDPPIPPSKIDEPKPIPSTKGSDLPPPIPSTKGSDLPPPLPAIPDVDILKEATKPPMPTGPAPIIKSRPLDESDKGQDLLKQARTELKKGDTDIARKIAIELINGPYDCKSEAAALLSSIDTKEAEMKVSSAKRAFDNGMEAYHSHNYAQALSIFKQIDGMLLTSESRKKLADMTAMAAAKKQEMEDAVAVKPSEKLPAKPKTAPGIDDLPPTGPAPVARTGSDNLLKQQEALKQVEFQALRSKALKVESEATARFGRGETDAALQDMTNFVAEVKSSNLEPSKQNLLCRPIEARMDRLKILKHQTDFITTEAREKRNFNSEMTHAALAKQKSHEDVAKLMRQAAKLMDEANYKEAYVKIQAAHQMEPDDAAVNGTMKMAELYLRKQQVTAADKSQEKFNFETMNGWHEYGDVTDKDPLRWSSDKEYRDRVLSRGPGSVGVKRSRSEAEKSIERKMSTPVSVNFKATSLESVIEHLQTMTAINFDLDLRGLKEGNVDPQQSITANLKDVSLKSALTIVCQQAGLKHVIENETIRITTPKNAAGRQVVKSIPVADLVVPAPNYGAHPGLSLMETLKDAKDSALGNNRNTSSMRTASGGLPGGSGTGTSMDFAGPAGRLSNQPKDGGAGSNTGPNGGTLERELIRLITTTIKPDSWSSLGGEGSIEYFPIGLALVVNQSPEVIEEVERLLESLRKLQDLEVSIEVKVVSLAETFYERIGVDFSMGIPTNAKPIGGPNSGLATTGLNSLNFGGNVIGLQTPKIPTPDLDIPIRATSFGRAVPPFGGFTNSFADGGVSLGLAFLSDIQVQMFLEAAQGDTRTNVMQAPKLTALNGTSASMTVGDFQFFVTGITVAQVGGQLVFIPQNVPYAVGITQPTPPNASIQNGLINFTPTAPQTPGLGLFIQPVVSADRRFVRLNIQQSFTNLISGSVQIPITTVITPQFDNGGVGQPTPFTQYLQQPRFSNLDTQTVVVVPDGGTVVMGGLKYMTEGRNEFGPPVLSKIPYLNRLFKNVAYGREGRSILIMVTPRVIINREEQERQTGVREDDFVGVIGP